ncbi:MAG: hypothetical protein DRP85_03390 [Candidatus Makaraimicrobium thalassicum]|nr:MAG: hypothetical protein DRP85_03390 [Candidatus Omnitrophota bacterium]
MIIKVVLVCSILCQFLATILSLRLIRVTGRRAAWTLIAAAIFLMIFRRGITLFRLVSGDMTHPPDLPAELVAFATSLCVLIGVALIAPLFFAIKNAEKELQEKEERVRTVADFTYNWEYWSGPGGGYIYVSPSCERITGYRPEEFIDDLHLIERITHPDDRVDLLRHIHSERDEEKVFSFEFRIVDRSGGEHWIEHICQPVRSADGRYLGRRASNSDISNRKKAEQALRASEKKYRELYESMRDGYVSVDLDGRITGCNLAFRSMLGYTDEEICKLTFKDIIPEKWHSAETEIINKQVLVKGYSEIYEKEYRRKDGTVIPVETRTYLIRDENYNTVGMWTSVSNITERKKIEEERKDAIEMKSHFVSTVSHELRTPLTAIRGGLDIVFDEVKELIDDRKKPFLDMTKRNIDRLSKMINDVLDFQKLEAGRMVFDMQEGDINELVEEVGVTMILLAEKKGLKFDIKLGEDLPLARFDRDRIIQVLANLVSNAIKFTEKGRITLVTAREEGVVKVSVHDTGPGIGEDEMPKLFREFTQLSSAKGRKLGGTGLGLAVSREIIEKHKGKIWAESKVGEGASFYFILPAG